jgi:hypothetical protein
MQLRRRMPFFVFASFAEDMAMDGYLFFFFFFDGLRD